MYARLLDDGLITRKAASFACHARFTNDVFFCARFCALRVGASVSEHAVYDAELFEAVSSDASSSTSAAAMRDDNNDASTKAAAKAARRAGDENLI